MPEQQKDVQSQKQKVPPNVPGGSDKSAAGKQGVKTPGGQDPKKAGMKDEDEDEDSESACGTGSCS